MLLIRQARLADTRHKLFDIKCDSSSRSVTSIHPSESQTTTTPNTGILGSIVEVRDGDGVIEARGSLVLPGLVHAHVHLDKPYLLDRCTIQDGTFKEALEKTELAKSEFNYDDVLARGRRLIRASVSHGVTAMRAFVEVDLTVENTCLDAGYALRTEFQETCDVLLTVFAQDGIFSSANGDIAGRYTERMCDLLEAALQKSQGRVIAIGSAPYVEKGGRDVELRNVRYILDIAERHSVDADFHLDFDTSRESRIMDLLHELERRPAFHRQRTAPHVPARGPLRVTVAHCRTLSRMSASELAQISAACEDLEIYFVGLPNSDLYMHHAQEESDYRLKTRGVMNVLELERLEGLSGHCALAVNNVNNLFTPQGDGDPLALCPLSVAAFQAATQASIRSLLEMVTIRSAAASGVRGGRHPTSLTLEVGDRANLVLLDGVEDVTFAAVSPPFARVTIKDGRIVSKRSVSSWTRN